MIKIQNVSFRYANTTEGALDNLSLIVKKGECVVLCGESGCGKTSVTRLINGLIPHYYEGELGGEISVGGIETNKAELFETAHIVGSVFQNPRSQFFCVDTTGEIAFGCENMGLPVETVESRIEEAVTDLDMKELLGRNIFKLSGGEKQKVACASVSALHPDVFVLDEPTSNLDMNAIESLKRTLLFWKRQGKTIVIAEHRLYWLGDICDRVVYMNVGKIGFDIPMSEFRALPHSEINSLGLRMLSLNSMDVTAPKYEAADCFTLCDYRFSYGCDLAMNIPSLQLPIGATIAVIGHNGAGKSTFTHCLCGLERKFKGSADFAGERRDRRKMLKKCYMVMQDVNHQLFCESVADEVRLGMSGENESKASGIMTRLGLRALTDRHPMSLSGGQKQRVAIASALLADKEILIFDEPTSGLDLRNMEQTSALLSSFKGEKTILIVTHDPELIIRCCTHVLHIEGGEVREFYALSGHEQQFLSFFNI
jgi:energy-coupling factor transport system ATP-binding protein